MNETGNKKFSMKSRLKSFSYAFNGLAHLFRTQHNFWIHIGAALFAVILGIVLKISAIEWVLIAIAAGMVFAAEAFNTAIEGLVDLMSSEINEKAGKIKDMAASAVLITAIAALVTGMFIFLPKII